MNDAGSQARRFLTKGAAAAAMLFLAACQTGPVPQQAPPPPVVTEAPPPPPQPVVEPQREEEDVQNQVAVLVPLSGDNAGIGRSIANAATMALLDTEEESVRINLYDTAAGGGARAAANEALADGNRLILGPLRADNVRVVAPIARNADVPVIAFSNDEDVAGNGVYIMGFTPSQAIRRIVDYADSQGASSYAALAPNGLYGRRATQAFLDAVDREGGRVERVETFERDRASIETAARRIAGGGEVDWILIADSGRIAQVAAPSLQLSGQLMGTELWAADRNLGEVAPMRGAVFAAVPDARFDQLIGRYRSRFDAAPYRLASLGYDAMLLVVRLARDWPEGGAFPEEGLMDRDGFGGVDGIFRFGRDGIAERALEVRRVTERGVEVVSPAATTFDD